MDSSTRDGDGITSTAAREAREPGAVSVRLRWAILAVLSLAQLMDVLDGTIINIALPDAQRDLGFDATNREWLVTGYALAYGSLLLFGGRLSDRFGRRRLFLIGLVGFAASSAVGGAAVDFDMLLAARIAQGAFAAGLAPAALSLVSVTFAADAKERGRAFAVFGAVSGMGGAIGLVLGGILVDAFSWRWCLYINVFVAVAALIGAVILVRDERRPSARRPLDAPGAVLVTAGLFAIVFGLGNSAGDGWASPITWLPLALGGPLVIGFVLRERATSNPLLPLTVVLHRNRAASYLALAISGVGSFAIFLYLSYFLQQTLAYSALKAGLAFLPFAGALVVGAAIAGSALLPRTGPRPLVPLGFLCSAAALILLTRIDRTSRYASGLLPSIVLAGFGLGLIFACAQNVATFGVDDDESGVTSALVNTMQQVGGSFGLAVFSSIAASAVSRYAADHPDAPRTDLATLSALASYHTVFWIAAAVFAAGGVITGAIYRSGPPEPDRR